MLGQKNGELSDKMLRHSRQALAQQEEELKREEEAYFEAKREASRVAKLQRAKEKAAKKNATINGSRSWLGDDEEWEVAGGEDDFEIFLANVKARSLAARAQVNAGDGQGSSSSSTVHTKDRSLTEGSSLDLEWDHEAGVEPELRPLSHTEEDLADWASLHKTNAPSSLHSSDLEWDDSFVSADELERRQLLGISAEDGNR
ncbi:hypothetical protein BaRGS_00010256 [Batillaria attramentaria]|uniref:Uncharacterized protein n=1 Tax=Batillaria attramentaria TaxID=370345 RepID=A0ABD0LGF6_9CAEN